MPSKTTTLTVRTPEGVTFEVPVASPFSRCLALAIDVAVVTAITMVLGQVVGALGVAASAVPVLGRVLSDFGSGAMIVMQFVISIGYGMATEWLWSGRTLGKRVMGLRVIDERGLALGFKQVVIRNLFRIIDMMPSTFYLLGGATCFVTKRCQRIGDIAAGTLVIREVAAPPPVLEEFVRTGHNSFAALPHLEARLRQRTSPEEARLVIDAMARRDELDPVARLEVFARLAEAFREKVDFPDEITLGLSDEQYVRNVASTLFRRASV
jgi:uncharacterized RDD family membrane protein YckC